MRARIAALVALGVLAALAAPAGAQEFKLVLSPEGGDGPPARVCLVSRSRTMASEQAPEGIRALGDVIRCEGARCEAARELRPARCQVCPEAPHDDCRAAVDLGGWRPADYSVVCADDDTTPPEGGTVYVSVESVEAENPPLITGFEVSGGRARWSSIDPISRPSYRVLGGDFESSPLSYPRGASEEPWAEVPVRRRCRCLDARTPDLVDVQRVLVDGQAVCRGEPGDGLLPVEVPAAGRDAVRSLVVESSAVTGAARWSGRWPAAPITLAPRRFVFTWVMPCEWPRAEQCPAVSIRGVECPVPAPVGDRCRYACRVLGDAVGSPPVEMGLHLDDPGLDLRAILGAAGQMVVGSVPADQRVVWVDVRRWRRDAVGDRIQAIDVLMLDGTVRTMELNERVDDRLTIPVPGARCGISLRTRIVGERDYAPGYGSIERGARLDVPPPEALVVPWDLHVSAGGGMVSTFFRQDAEGITSSVSGTLVGTVGVRARPAQSAWFGEVRAVYLFVGGWPWGPITIDGGSGVATESETYSALAGELVVGRSFGFAERTLHAFAGAGVGGSFSVLGESDQVEQGAAMGTLLLGIAWPLGGQYVNRLQPRLDVRYWFGSETLRYSTDFASAPVRAALAAHALLLTFSIDLRL